MAKNTDIRRIETELRRIIKVSVIDITRGVAKLAEDHFKENFRQGGFVNGGLHKWKDVKRRDPASGWYGFSYKGEKRTHYSFTRDSATGKTRKSKSQKKLNFSPTATQRTVLTSRRNYLMNSTKGRVRGETVVISNSAPHAKIHNEGGIFKVFGKRSARMPKRQFIGESKELNSIITKYVTDTLTKKFNRI